MEDSIKRLQVLAEKRMEECSRLALEASRAGRLAGYEHWTDMYGVHDMYNEMLRAILREKE